MSDPFQTYAAEVAEILTGGGLLQWGAHDLPDVPVWGPQPQVRHVDGFVVPGAAVIVGVATALRPGVIFLIGQPHLGSESPWIELGGGSMAIGLTPHQTFTRLYMEWVADYTPPPQELAIIILEAVGKLITLPGLPAHFDYVEINSLYPAGFTAKDLASAGTYDPLPLQQAAFEVRFRYRSDSRRVA